MNSCNKAVSIKQKSPNSRIFTATCLSPKIYMYYLCIIISPASGLEYRTDKTWVRQQTVSVVLSETARYGADLWLTVTDEVCQPRPINKENTRNKTVIDLSIRGDIVDRHVWNRFWSRFYRDTYKLQTTAVFITDHFWSECSQHGLRIPRMPVDAYSTHVKDCTGNTLMTLEWKLSSVHGGGSLGTEKRAHFCC